MGCTVPVLFDGNGRLIVGKNCDLAKGEEEDGTGGQTFAGMQTSPMEDESTGEALYLTKHERDGTSGGANTYGLTVFGTDFHTTAPERPEEEGLKDANYIQGMYLRTLLTCKTTDDAIALMSESYPNIASPDLLLIAGMNAAGKPEAAVIEYDPQTPGSDHLHVEILSESFVLTNLSHALTGNRPTEDIDPDPYARQRRADQLLRNATDPEGIMRLLADHEYDDQLQLNICRHPGKPISDFNAGGRFETQVSLVSVLDAEAGTASLYHLEGNPCKAQPGDWQQTNL